jgi:Rrf2 family protein
MRLTLTKRGEYGIRLVLHLARQEPGARMTAAQLAEVCQIPAGNVPTIMSLLSRAGILTCNPGRAGGCTMARPPEEISALEIIEALEGPLEITTCLLDSRRCHGRDPECAVHHAWSEGRNAAIAALARTTLADAVRREREIEAGARGARKRSKASSA